MSEEQKITDEQLEEIITYLEGSCLSLTEGVSQVVHNDADDTWLTQAQRERLDSRIFECEDCGWWHDVSEMAEDSWSCLDCKPEGDE